ncbi:uncharacterized protein [Haliotis cracherodii]|uniref:uncharacterized protein n=1 Tax=Haliotis cracherodii TaxID=6455 RepID=UPI0039EA1292
MTRRRNLRKPNLEAMRAAVASGGKQVLRPLSPGESPPPGGQVYTLRREDPLQDALFPRWSPIFVAVVTLVIRVVYVCQKRNWWVLHPDEVFQGLEVAHSEVYGYGFRMYEYLPPPDSVMTSAEDQENTLGFYSLRSFLYPHIYTICFAIVGLFNPNLNLFLVGRLIHVVVSSSLPLAVYRLCDVIYGSHDVAVLAAVFVSSSLHLTIFGTHTLINSFLSPIFMFCLAMVLSAIKLSPSVTAKPVPDIQNGGTPRRDKPAEDDTPGVKDPGVKAKPVVSLKVEARRLKYASCGFILGMLCYLRLDLAMFLVVSVTGWLIVCVRGKDHQKVVVSSLLTVTLGAFCAILLGGCVDFVYFGWFFLSPYQWINFNVLNGLSNRVFGKGYLEDYLKNLNAVPSAVFLNLCTLGIIPVLCWSHHKKIVKFRTPVLFLVGTLVMLFTAYSFQSHKETRILHNVFVLQAMVWAGAVQSSLAALGSGRALPLRRISYVLVTCVVILQANDCYKNFPSSSDKSNANWAFNGHWDSGSVNECLDYVRQQNDVTGLFLDYTVYGMGGFSVLRKDVPLIARVHHEYHEFDPKYLPNYRQNIDPKLRLMNRLTDIMHVKHSRYILGRLVNSTQYNYIITKNVRRFRPLAFTNVYNSTDFRVLKFLPRNPNATIVSRLRLIKDLQSFPFDGDASILEFEGSWLFSVGSYKKAVDRLRAAIIVNASRIRPFQLMSLSYSNMDMLQEAADAEQQCFALHSFGKCIQPQPRIVLSPDYNLDI